MGIPADRVNVNWGRSFMAISDRIEADRHKHWLMQFFPGGQKELNIEVNNQRMVG